MYIIRTSKGPLGCVKDGKTYITGFNNIAMVSRTSQQIKVPPVVNLDRSLVMDITDDLKEGLNSYGFKDEDMTFTSITIDTEALLTIEKEKDPALRNGDNVVIDTLDPGDFMYLAFEKNLGLIMPYATYLDNDEYLVYQSNVVDPSNDPELFRKSLKL